MDDEMDREHTEPTVNRLASPEAARATQVRWLMALGAAALLLLAAGGLYAYRSGVQPQQLAALGYPGVFLVMFLSGSSILFPAPGLAAVLAAGVVWNPVLVGMSAGLGNATGELTGYLAARAGAAALKGREPPRWWNMLREWLTRHGFLAILLLAMIPNPTFDVVGLLAGSLGYPPRRFWLACALGNSLKYVAVAYLGDAALLLPGLAFE